MLQKSFGLFAEHLVEQRLDVLEALVEFRLNVVVIGKQLQLVIGVFNVFDHAVIEVFARDVLFVQSLDGLLKTILL